MVVSLCLGKQPLEVFHLSPGGSKADHFSSGEMSATVGLEMGCIPKKQFP